MNPGSPAGAGPILSNASREHVTHRLNKTRVIKSKLMKHLTILISLLALAGQSNMQGQAEIGTFDYHYLGCAKTFALMGKAFAEATLQLHK